MPWKECSVMDEKLQFVARRLAGEPMTELCTEFGISRKTGYNPGCFLSLKFVYSRFGVEPLQ